MGFFRNRPIFQNRQMVQRPGDDIQLSGQTTYDLGQYNSYIYDTYEDFVNGVSGATFLALQSNTGITSETPVSGWSEHTVFQPGVFRIRPPESVVFDGNSSIINTTASTRQDVTGYIATSMDSDGTVVWKPSSSLTGVTATIGCDVQLNTIEPCSGDTVTINGNFRVNGTVTSATTIIETETVKVEDNNIELNYGGNHSTAIGGGITVLSGQSNSLDSRIYTLSDGTFMFEPGLSASTGLYWTEGSSGLSIKDINGSHTVSGNYNLVAGGQGSLLSGTSWSFMAGGSNNTIKDGTGINSIMGGTDNILDNTTGASIIGGNNNEINTNSTYATILGGGSNLIGTGGTYTTILGGTSNLVDDSDWSSIVGGQLNQSLDSDSSVIAGGRSNTIKDVSDYSFIGGGEDNTISGHTHSFIIGGSGNTISYSPYDGDGEGILGSTTSTIESSKNTLVTSSKNSGIYKGQTSSIHSSVNSNIFNYDSTASPNGLNVIIGSEDVSISGTPGSSTQTKYNTVIGGNPLFTTSIKDSSSTSIVGGGGIIRNLTYGGIFGGNGTISGSSIQYSTLVGGRNTTLNNASTSLVGGGNSNTIESSSSSFIGGGEANTLTSSDESVLIGGRVNELSNSRYGSIVSGSLNKLYDSITSTLVGGANNTLSGDSRYSSIIGGFTNQLDDNSGYSSIIGGLNSRIIDSDRSFIGGGDSLDILSATSSSILAGNGSEINNSTYSAIISGGEHIIRETTLNSTILGGTSNTIQDSSQYSSIVGGTSNTINGGINSVVVGGTNNIISGTTNTVILGGENVTTTVDNTVYIPNLITSGGIESGSNIITTTQFKAGHNYDANTASGNTFTFNCDSGMTQHIDLEGATTATTVTFTNQKEGNTYTILVVQGSGTYDLNLPSGWWLNDTAPFDFTTLADDGRVIITATYIYNTWYFAVKELTYVV